MQRFFKENTYQTPKKVHRYFMDKMMLGGRWWFYYRYIKLVLKYRFLALAGKYNDEEWAKSSFEIHQEIEKCGGKIHIDGLENIENEEGPVVFVGNHMSTAETQLLPGIIEPIKNLTFVVKEALVKGNTWGPIMRARNPIVVAQRNAREDMVTVLHKGAELIKKGRSVFLFPQGERTRSFNCDTFNTLGIKLAKKANVKIIPVALKTDYWGNGIISRTFGPIRRRKKIYFSFGKAQSIVGNGKELHKEIISFIHDKLVSWQHKCKVLTKNS